MIASDRPRRRSGFTLLELMISGVLMGIMAALLAAAWPVFHRSASEVAMRGQLAQEADFALSRIAQDLAGLGEAAGDRLCLVAITRRVEDDDGDPTPEVFLDLSYDDRWAAAGVAEAGLVARVVTYRLDPDARTLGRRGSWHVPHDPDSFELVARNVAALNVVELLGPPSGSDSWIEVELVMRHPVPLRTGRRRVGTLERSSSLIAVLPDGPTP